MPAQLLSAFDRSLLSLVVVRGNLDSQCDNIFLTSLAIMVNDSRYRNTQQTVFSCHGILTLVCHSLASTLRHRHRPEWSQVWCCNCKLTSGSFGDLLLIYGALHWRVAVSTKPSGESWLNCRLEQRFVK